MKKFKYPAQLFQLQAEFAEFLSLKHELELDETLFSNTAFYVRCIGHSDEHLPDSKNHKWQQLLSDKPDKNVGEYFYKRYQEFEESKPKLFQSKKQKPCFHAFFHNITNKYELHFDPHDPKGNLASNRQEARIAELKDMFATISESSNDQTMLFVRTWLLNIEAFNRLFPPVFSKKAVLWDSNNKTYDNTQWGQFISKDGEFKTSLAKTFKQKWTKRQKNFNSYFPLPALRSEMPVIELLEFYQKT